MLIHLLLYSLHSMQHDIMTNHHQFTVSELKSAHTGHLDLFIAYMGPYLDLFSCTSVTLKPHIHMTFSLGVPLESFPNNSSMYVCMV